MIQKEQKELCITILIVIAAFGILFVFADFRNENMGQITAMFVKEPEGVKVNSVDSGNLGSITGLIIEEVSGKEIEGYIKEASKAYGIPENLIKAHITAESNFNPRAVAIGCGAAGLIQLMPGTAKQLGLKTFNNYDFVTCNAGKTEELLNFMAGKSLKEIALVDERFDPKKNIMAGEKYLKQQIDKFNGDIELGLAAYNAGPGAVNKRCCSDGSCVKFAECKSRLPQETQNYVEKIMRLSGEDIKVLPKYSYSTGEDIIKEDGKIYIIRTIGTYSVNPSFVVRESYNIGDYELIKQQFLGYGNNKGVLDLVAECEKKDEKKNVEECVKEAVIEVNEREEMKSNGLVLFNGPCNAKENIWSDFIEDFGDCLENKEDNCYCEISLNQSEQTAFKDEIRIKVEKNQGTVIKLDDKDNPLS
ncbi:MAG: lytic transglycosylase domain-containing protein, partial [Candidatus Woesearchaeota archaeon]|nr:lytic transglycosylase domain-containing protein [Candidatus Woesearchaeota archaeon]